VRIWQLSLMRGMSVLGACYLVGTAFLHLSGVLNNVPAWSLTVAGFVMIYMDCLERWMRSWSSISRARRVSGVVVGALGLAGMMLIYWVEPSQAQPSQALWVAIAMASGCFVILYLVLTRIFT